MFYNSNYNSKLIRITDFTSRQSFFSECNAKGYIIISSCEDALNPAQNRERICGIYKELRSSRHKFIPFWGEIIENKGNPSEKAVKARAFVVFNITFSYDRTRFYSSERLNELGKIWCWKFNRKFFLYNPRGEEKKPYFLDRYGHEKEEASTAELHNQPADFFAWLKLYFKTIAAESSKASKDKVPFEFTGDLFGAPFPGSWGEACGRSSGGEKYFKW